MRLINEDGSEEWEPGGTLGNDERYVVAVRRDADRIAEIDAAMGMQRIELRIPIYVMEAITEHATARGLIPLAMVRQILEEFAKEYKNHEHEAVVYVP